MACPKPSTPEVATPTDKGPELTVAMPDSDAARAFARKMLKANISDWSPTDDRAFQWESVVFKADGTFVAKAAIRAAGESVPCDEIGTWSVDKAVDKTHATMDWTVSKTDCATRSSGDKLRVSVKFEGDEINIAYR
jgi:hypothetical protein